MDFPELNKKKKEDENINIPVTGWGNLNDQLKFTNKKNEKKLLDQQFPDLEQEKEIGGRNIFKKKKEKKIKIIEKEEEGPSLVSRMKKKKSDFMVIKKKKKKKKKF